MMIKMMFVVLLAISMGVPYAGYRLTGRKKAGGKISLVAGLFLFFGAGGLALSCGGTFDRAFLHRSRHCGGIGGKCGNRGTQRGRVCHGKGTYFCGAGGVDCALWAFDFVFHSGVENETVCNQ